MVETIVNNRLPKQSCHRHCDKRGIKIYGVENKTPISITDEKPEKEYVPTQKIIDVMKFFAL